ncbi:hypothetical protein Syun_004419 [Stephania yunnanensis]|uniref:Uncharacterized protein n=1 Tax=Stephania yunnanensis TaxID=152371 RepID=A0AAP0L4I3_9MAGN
MKIVVRLQNYKFLANRIRIENERARDIGDDGDRRDETERPERRRDQRQQCDQVARPDGETETTANRRPEQSTRETSSHDQTERRDDRTGWTSGDETIDRRDETERRI